MWYWRIFRLFKFKCRKKLIDKLVEECTEIIEETRLIKTSAKNKHKCSSCTVYRVFFWIFFILFIINVGTGIYFTYYKYLSRNKENVPKYDYIHETAIHWTYKWEKLKK